jgi:hypothetical protein
MGISQCGAKGYIIYSSTTVPNTVPGIPGYSTVYTGTDTEYSTVY